eukprot:3240713-Rhodomonas_salina.1
MANDAVWEQRFNELLQWHDKHGDWDPPKNKASTMLPLASWVTNQRWLYRNLSVPSAKDKLAPHRRERLEVRALARGPQRASACLHVGPPALSLRVPSASAQCLARFFCANCLPPGVCPDGARPSGPVRQSVGFSWTALREPHGLNHDAWNDMYEALRHFQQQHGHCRVQRSVNKK